MFTSAGGFRDFGGESTFNVGENNGVLYVWEDGTDQVIVYGASAWASVQEKKRLDAPVVTGRRRLVTESEDEADENTSEVPSELVPADLIDSAFSEEGADDLEPQPVFERGPVFQPKHA